MPIETFYSGLALVIALAILILLILLAQQRRLRTPEKHTPQNVTARLKQMLLYTFRLVGFTLLVILLLANSWCN